MTRTRYLLILLALLGGAAHATPAAHAQAWWRSGNPGAGAITPVTGGNALVLSIATDYATGSTPQRPNLITTTLSPSSTTTNVWENWYANLQLNGPGTATGEINLVHPVFTVVAGATATSSEVFEASLVNSGAVGAHVNYLALPNNLAGGTATSIYGFKGSLINANSTAATVGSYATLDCEAMSGGGSAPTNNYCIRNGDSTAQISSLGNVVIGTLATQNNKLYIAGADTSAGTYSFMIKNSSAGNVFAINNAGGILAGGVGSVSCAANTVTLATLVVTNGIITHC